jgi:hypothetical protein
MYRKRLEATFVLTSLCLMLSFQFAFASVGFGSFKAQPHSASTIMLTWDTASEAEIVGFLLYRSETPSPEDWGTEIYSEAAKGSSVSGHLYTYEDTVTPGRTYYYLLREITSSGSDDHFASAGIDVPTFTPTATGTTSAATTPSRTPSATSTQQPASSGGGSNATPTPTTPAPTATRRFTNTPVISPLGTPTLAQATQVPLRTPTPSPLPPASVASPTGRAPVVTVPPTLTRATDQAVTLIPTQEATFTLAPSATFARVALAETATPRPTKDVTPIIFAAETTTASGSPTPDSTAQVAGQGRRSGSLALMVGGGALALAGLLAAGFLFIRSRKP